MAKPDVALYAVKLMKNRRRFECKFISDGVLYSKKVAGSARREIEKCNTL
jgi:hypothetical protein